MTLPFDPIRSLSEDRLYPDGVFRAFEPINALADIIALSLGNRIGANYPATLGEVEAVLRSHYLVSEFYDSDTAHVPHVEDSGQEVHIRACLVSFIAMKIRDDDIHGSTLNITSQCRALMRQIAQDNRLTKQETIEKLSGLKKEANDLIRVLRKPQEKHFTFPNYIERYKHRVDTEESPGGFFNRVYWPYVAEGLTPLQVRYSDPVFYDILHSWCSKKGVRLRLLFDRTKPAVLEIKQRAYRERRPPALEP